MASSANHFALLFLLLLVSTFQIQARDSQFFSKFTNTNTNTNVNPNYIPKETEIPQKETTMPKQGGESGVTTETSQNGYGLYSRSNDRFPTTATNSNGESYTFSNIPETDPLAEYNDQGYDNNNNNNNDNANNNNNYGYGTKQVSLSDTRYQGNENSNYYYNNNNNGYKGNGQGMSDTRFQGNGEKYYNNDRYANQKSLSDNGNNNYHYYYNNNNNKNGYQAERQGMRNNNNKNGYQAERQGMSDTRFVEKGKYFYDLNNENAYLNEFQFRGMGTENKYNSGNNENSYEVDNSRDGEDENQERQQEFGP